MPYIETPGGVFYDLTSFSCYYAQQADDGSGTWNVVGSQVDYSNQVLLAAGYPSERSGVSAVGQVLGSDTPVRQFPPPAPPPPAAQEG